MIKQPGNPFQIFVNGSETKQFKFPVIENPKMFYITGQSKHWMPCSMMVPARDGDHALDLFKDALIFARECKKHYASSESRSDKLEVNVDSWSLLIELLQGREKGQMSISYDRNGSTFELACSEFIPDHIVTVNWAFGGNSMSS